jgi:acetyl-CoA decarbonylase/synthase, CODH/ACS complex subunit delta
MTIPAYKESWKGSINTVTLGTEANGKRTVTLGGHTTLPFLHFEGTTRPPAVALEVWDCPPTGWPAPLVKAWGDVFADPAAWAKRGVQELGVDVICLRFMSASPDLADATPDACCRVARAVADAVPVPLFLWGCDDNAKDNEVLAAVSRELKGHNVLFGMATEDNYRTLTVSCLADGHAICALSPLDINIQKQVNILISDMGFPAERIVDYPTTGGLGYGLEYAYSIMERARLAALGGDRMMAMPVLAIVGAETWKAKESIAGDEAAANWGAQDERGQIWEAVTAAGFLQAGVDVLVMRHPAAIRATQQTTAQLMVA